MDTGIEICSKPPVELAVVFLLRVSNEVKIPSTNQGPWIRRKTSDISARKSAFKA